jgi:alpha-tubulin suppressor-like RCC1 family protein
MSLLIGLRLLAISGGNTANPQNLYLWGDNTYGQLGDNRTPSLFSWRQVSLGGAHSIALRNDGAIFAWGNNGFGQLGDNTVISKSSPVLISNPFDSFTQVSAGRFHNVAIRSDGTLWGWGLNIDGRLGDNSTVNKSTITFISGDSWTAISAGNTFTLGLRGNSVYAWGDNGSGQLGNSTIINTSSPVQVGSSSYTQIRAGAFHSTAISSDGKLFTWGNNAYGQLGTSDFTPRSAPVQITNSSFTAVAAGLYHTGGITTQYALFTWGLNNYGQLGTNVVPSNLYWTNVYGTFNHRLALRSDGALFTWGQNNSGQLGLGDTINRSSPVQIGTSSWIIASAGFSHTTAITSDGRLFAWGDNYFQQVGNAPVGVMVSWSKLSVGAGTNNVFGIASNGYLWGWGNNSYGELGIGDQTARSSPTLLSTIPHIDITVGQSHSIAVRADNTLWIAGINSSGLLGNYNYGLNTLATSYVPVSYTHLRAHETG